MQQLRWRAIAVVTVLVATGALIATRPARLGLDLRGGTQIALQAVDKGGQKIDGDTMNRTLEVLRRRVDQLGVAEPTLQRSGDRRIIVELPGLKDPDQAVAVIGQTAQLAFHPVLGVEAGGQTTASTVPAPARTGWSFPTRTAAAVRLGPAAADGRRRADGQRHVPGRWLAGRGRVPGRRPGRVGGAHREGRLRSARGSHPPGGHRPRPESDLEPPGVPRDPLQRGHHRRFDRHHRGLQREGGQGPGPPHPSRGAARAGRNRRAAHGRPDPRRRPPSGRASRRPSSAPPSPSSTWWPTTASSAAWPPWPWRPTAPSPSPCCWPWMPP